MPEIQAMLQQATQSKTDWLRPLKSSLTPPGGRLIRTLSGHSSSVNAVAVTPDGKQVISGSSDNTLKFWDLETGEELFTLTGYSNPRNRFVFTSNHETKRMFDSFDNTLKVWRVSNRLNGKQLICVVFDSTLKVWDLSTGEVIASFTGESRLYCCAVAPDGVTIVAGELSGQLHFLRLEGIEASP